MICTIFTSVLSSLPPIVKVLSFLFHIFSWPISTSLPATPGYDVLQTLEAKKILRWNPPRICLILLFSGQKPCTRII